MIEWEISEVPGFDWRSCSRSYWLLDLEKAIFFFPPSNLQLPQVWNGVIMPTLTLESVLKCYKNCKACHHKNEKGKEAKI